jgi:Cu-processing system ATP-binding protein
LLDEPTTGLDPALRQTFYDILHELRDDGATVLISSHALSELEGRAEHVLIMNRGILVAEGTLAELRRLSQLPIRVSFDLAPRSDKMPEWLADGNASGADGHVVLVPDDERKMALLRLAAADPRVRNIEVATPTLDDLYAHFLRAREAAE